jgi:hypothetical protein
MILLLQDLPLQEVGELFLLRTSLVVMLKRKDVGRHVQEDHIELGLSSSLWQLVANRPFFRFTSRKIVLL